MSRLGQAAIVLCILASLTLHASASDHPLHLVLGRIVEIDLTGPSALLDFGEAKVNYNQESLDLRVRKTLVYSYSSNLSRGRIVGQVTGNRTPIELQVQLNSNVGTSKGFVTLRPGAPEDLVVAIPPGFERQQAVDIRARVPLSAGPVQQDRIRLSLRLKEE